MPGWGQAEPGRASRRPEWSWGGCSPTCHHDQGAGTPALVLHDDLADVGAGVGWLQVVHVDGQVVL